MRNTIPAHILDKYNKNQLSGTFNAFTMFVDIKGFTKMTEKLTEHGSEGAEVLSEILNRIFGPSIEAVYDNGGFISSFAGDAFTAVFETGIAEFCLRASFIIQKSFIENEFMQTRFGTFPISAKIGLSFGDVHYFIIESKTQNAYYYNGDAINNCAYSEKFAKEREIVADKAFINRLQNKMSILYISKDHARIGPHEEMKLPGPSQNIKQTGFPGNIVKKFIHPAIEDHTQRGEFRRIVSVFIGFDEKGEFQNFIKQTRDMCFSYGGYLAHIGFGDKGGVMLLIFGAPVGREKLLQRACNCILDLSGLSSTGFKAGFTAGTAFVGFVGSERQCEYTALSTEVNLASRLMTEAGPNEVLTTSILAKRLKGQYVFKSRGHRSFKGFSETQEIFQLVSRSETRGHCYQYRFIGREKETLLLKEIIGPILRNKFGGIVYIDGEAGIGKSHFISEFSNNNKDYSFYFLSCDEILQKSFNPFASFFSSFFRQNKKNSNKKNHSLFFAVYEELLNMAVGPELKNELFRVKSIIGALIGIEWKGSLYSQLNSKGRYENTLFAIKCFFICLSLVKPLVLVLDDAHWIDNDSLEVFKILLRNVEDYPFIVLVLCRPGRDGAEFHLQLDSKADMRTERILLEGLTKSTVKEILSVILGHKDIPENTINVIYDKSSGNPFFTEQLALYLMENRLFDSEFNMPSESGSIPYNISQVIIARVDSLSNDLKDSIKAASILGQEFLLDVFRNLLKSLNVLKIQKDFKKCLNMGINEQIWLGSSEMTYVFKHSLIRDTVYEIQLKDSLRKSHDIAGRIIENLYPGKPAYYEELADHYDKAENPKKAAEYLEKSADLTLSSYQSKKAYSYYNRLLKYLDKFENTEKYFKIILNQCSILISIGKWDKARSFYESNINFAKKCNFKIQSRYYKDFAELLDKTGNPEKAKQYLDKALRISVEHNDKSGIANIYSSLGVVFWGQYNFEQAEEYLNKSISLFKEINDLKSAANAIGNLGGIYFSRKEFDKAINNCLLLMDVGKKFGDIMTVCAARGNLGILYQNMGDYDKAMDCYEQDLAVYLKFGYKVNLARTYVNMGVLYEALKNS